MDKDEFETRIFEYLKDNLVLSVTKTYPDYYGSEDLVVTISLNGKEITKDWIEVKSGSMYD